MKLIEWESIRCIGDYMCRKAPIAGIARENWAITKILTPSQAILALTACVTEPGNAHARPDRNCLNPTTHRVNYPDNFVPGDQRKFRIGEFAIDDVQIGAANRTGFHTHSDLTLRGYGVRSLLQGQRPADSA